MGKYIEKVRIRPMTNQDRVEALEILRRDLQGYRFAFGYNQYQDYDFTEIELPENIRGIYGDVEDTLPIMGGYTARHEKLLGLVAIKHDFYCSRMEIENIYVLENYRRKGVGKEVFDYILSRKHPHTKEVRLFTNELNEGACEFYEEYGFKLIAKIPRNIFANNVWYDEYLYELVLEGGNEDGR